jgi:hypothetical protein
LHLLSDAKLQEYLKQLIAKLTEEGDLAGTSSEGVQLLQRYLDVTGDFQNVNLLAIHVFTRDFLFEPAVQALIIGYRILLGAWHLLTPKSPFCYVTECLFYDLQTTTASTYIGHFVAKESQPKCEKPSETEVHMFA